MQKPFFKTYYAETIVPALMESHGFGNIHQTPRIEKIVINSGISATAEKAVVTETSRDIELIAGQRPIVTRARKSIASFKLREGMPIGVKVTLRGDTMYEFLYRLISIAIPAIRDFRGLSSRLDGNGNYTLGITDHTIFPEISIDHVKRTLGMDITIVTTATDDATGRELLRQFGMPFRRQEGTSAISA